MYVKNKVFKGAGDRRSREKACDEIIMWKMKDWDGSMNSSQISFTDIGMKGKQLLLGA
jgi:hypothetical protein